jgi:phosphoglycolate phosphatase
LPSFDLFVFDFDGTLADSRLSISKSLNHALLQFGYAEIEPSLIYPRIGKELIAETVMRFQPSIPKSQLEEILECFRAYQREHVREDLRYFPEVRESLMALKARKKGIAILSNKSNRQLLPSLEAFEMLDFFDLILGTGLIAEIKPHKAGMDYIWQKLPVESSRTVLIGDSEVDVQTAKNAGIEMIAVNHGTDSAESLKAMGAAYSIETFSEILNFA